MTKYIKWVLGILPGVVAVIEFLIFWWNNNGLHTSRYDFWMEHPMHCTISFLVMLFSAILFSLWKNLKKS